MVKKGDIIVFKVKGEDKEQEAEVTGVPAYNQNMKLTFGIEVKK